MAEKVLTAILPPRNEHLRPGQHGELLGPMQNPCFEAHVAWSLSRLTKLSITEADPTVMKRLVTATSTAVVENFMTTSDQFGLAFTSVRGAKGVGW